MTISQKTSLLCPLLLLLVCLGPDGAQAQEREKITVFTSLAPVAFVVGEIGGDQVAVHSLIPPGRDPHTFSPNPRQVVALSQASIYFTMAMTFEEELLSRFQASATSPEIIDCSAGIARRKLADDHHHHHDAGQGDPHIWLGIDPLAQMAKNISVALSHEAPEDQERFQENLAHFLARLARLQSEMGHLLAPFKGRTVLVFHPSFGYFADSFGLVQEAVEVEGKSPSPQQLTTIIKLARAKGIRVIFSQPQYDQRPAQRIAQAIDGEVVALDPLAADVFANLQTMAEKIATALGK